MESVQVGEKGPFETIFLHPSHMTQIYSMSLYGQF